MSADLKECPYCGSPAIERMYLPEGCGTGVVGCITTGCAMEDAEIPIDDWNSRAIAPPVAAGSVDTEEFRNLLAYWSNGETDAYKALMLGNLTAHIDAYGAQQREAGKAEQTAFLKEGIDRGQDEFNRHFTSAVLRANKAEADLASARLIWAESRQVDEHLTDRIMKAEARVAELMKKR